MKFLGEAMHTAPNAEQAETLATVLELAVAWQRGAVDLAGVRSACSGHDRFVAIRCADLGSEDKRVIMALVDALVDADTSVIDSSHGIVHMSEVYEGGAKAVTNHEGKRVYAWPMFSMDGEPVYPLVELPPGEERRTREEAKMLAYREYRKARRGTEPKRWSRE